MQDTGCKMQDTGNERSTSNIEHSTPNEVKANSERGIQAEALIEALTEEGIEVALVDGKLIKIRGHLDDEIRGMLREFKDDLLPLVSVYHTRPEPCTHCGKNLFYHEPCVFDGAGGEVCGYCKRAVRGETSDIRPETAGAEQQSLGV